MARDDTGRMTPDALTDAIIGGWSVQAIGQFQSGLPIDFGNIYFNGDPTGADGRITPITPTCRCSIPAGSISTMRRCRPTASTILSSSATISASGWPATSATSRRASMASAGPC